MTLFHRMKFRKNVHFMGGKSKVVYSHLKKENSFVLVHAPSLNEVKKCIFHERWNHE